MKVFAHCAGLRESAVSSVVGSNVSPLLNLFQPRCVPQLIAAGTFLGMAFWLCFWLLGCLLAFLRPCGTKRHSPYHCIGSLHCIAQGPILTARASSLRNDPSWPGTLSSSRTTSMWVAGADSRN